MLTHTVIIAVLVANLVHADCFGRRTDRIAYMFGMQGTPQGWTINATDYVVPTGTPINVNYCVKVGGGLEAYCRVPTPGDTLSVVYQQSEVLCEQNWVMPEVKSRRSAKMPAALGNFTQVPVTATYEGKRISIEGEDHVPSEDFPCEHYCAGYQWDFTKVEAAAEEAVYLERPTDSLQSISNFLSTLTHMVIHKTGPLCQMFSWTPAVLQPSLLPFSVPDCRVGFDLVGPCTTPDISFCTVGDQLYEPQGYLGRPFSIGTVKSPFSWDVCGACPAPAGRPPPPTCECPSPQLCAAGACVESYLKSSTLDASGANGTLTASSSTTATALPLSTSEAQATQPLTGGPSNTTAPESSEVSGTIINSSSATTSAVPPIATTTTVAQPLTTTTARARTRTPTGQRDENRTVTATAPVPSSFRARYNAIMWQYDLWAGELVGCMGASRFTHNMSRIDSNTVLPVVTPLSSWDYDGIAHACSQVTDSPDHCVTLHSATHLIGAPAWEAQTVNVPPSWPVTVTAYHKIVAVQCYGAF